MSHIVYADSSASVELRADADFRAIVRDAKRLLLTLEEFLGLCEGLDTEQVKAVWNE